MELKLPGKRERVQRVYGCSDGGHAVGWCNSRGGETEGGGGGWRHMLTAAFASFFGASFFFLH